MELTGGYPFWLIKDGLPFQYPKLLRHATCDTIIIGGGISGALTAYYLTNAGINCILVDGRTIGLGSTCASTSLLQYELDMPLHQLIKKCGHQQAVRAYQLCGEAVDKLVAMMHYLGLNDYNNTGSLFFSRHKRQQSFMEKEYAARKEAGFEVDLLAGSELKKMYGLKAASGILSQKGARTNAYTFTHKILQHCMRKGLRVYDRTKIKSINYSKKKATLKTNEGITISAKYIVNATGFEVIDFIKKGIVDLDCTYAIITETMQTNKEIWKGHVLMWDTDDPYLYSCITKENRIIIGGRDEPFTNKKTLHIYIDKKTKQLEKDFNLIFPKIPFKTEFSWSGVFGKTKDSLPYIGRYPKTPNTYYALGFGGNGITFSLIAAQMITDMILGKKNKDAEIFSFKRS